MRETATSDSESFGQLLRRQRITVGLTQEELAELAGLSARGIADLERGARTRPYPATMKRLVRALDLPEAAVAELHAARRAAGSASEISATPPASAASLPRSLVGSPGRSSLFIGRDAGLAVFGAQAGTSAHAAGKVAPWVHTPFVTTTASVRLLERMDQVAALNEHLAAVVRSPGGRLVFIGGEAGVGKTALIRSFCAEHARSLQILSGSCDALFTPRPMGPILDIAQVIGGELADLTERGGRPYEIATALMRALRSAAPTILILEDLHWADEATLDVLRLVARRVETIPALVLASYRDDLVDRVHPLRVLLGELPTGAAITRMRLSPLSLAAVAELAEPFDVDSVDLYRKTAGNAFFVTEVLAAGDVAIPPTVRDAVLARAARLRPGAMALLEAVAVVPPLAEPWLLEGLAPEAVEFLDECLASGTLTPATGGVAFRHELARLAIEESLPPVRRVALHRRALEAMTAPPSGTPDLARLAHHAEAAADKEAVLRFAPAAAARAAALGAHREAVAQYGRALRSAAGLSPKARAELLARQAHEGFLSDQSEVWHAAGYAAVEGFHEAGDQIREGGVLHRLSHWLRCSGSAPEAYELGRKSVALLEQFSQAQTRTPILTAPPGERELALAYGNLAFLHMNAENAERTTFFGRQALQLAQRLQDTEALVHVLNTLGTMEFLGGAPEGRAKLEESLELARNAGLEEAAGRAFLNLAWAAARSRSYAGAEHQIQAGLDYCSEHGLVLWRHILLAYAARHSLDAGKWSEAVERAQEVLRATRSVVPRVHALVVLGLVRARRGDPDSLPLLDEALALAQQTGELQHIAPVGAARAELAWLEASTEAVAAATQAVLEMALVRRAAWLVGELACWRWRVGLEQEAPDCSAEPYALELSGQWQQAAEMWTLRGCPYEAALALGSANDHDALRRSLAELQRLGGRAAATIVARRLRESGARGLPRGPRLVTRSNPAHLTARQLEILDLLTQGLRNAEIADRLYVSARTVDHHVSAILDKLDARSRTEAGQQAARLGIHLPQTVGTPQH